ncbi:MAG: magnesium/cobalt transporter CorA [Anaerolineales bacterium]
MKRFFHKPRTVGYAPGSLIPKEEPDQHPLKLTLFEYGPEMSAAEQQVQQLSDCVPFKTQTAVNWLNIDGSHQVELLEDIGRRLEIHPLVLEDILNTNQRPKLEDYDQYLFLELNMLTWSEESSQVEAEQISLLLGENYLVTFQDLEKDVFDPVRKRIREGKGRLTSGGPGYLAYSLIDAVVDHYFIVLENLGEQIEFLEEELVTDPDPGTLHAIHDLKRELIFLRKSVWPLREVISALERGESPLFQESSLVYLRDVYDHVIQIIDTIETFREMASGMLDIYLSSISNRMNEVMKVLTIIATVFIPLSFVVGLYGMNFKYMPELGWKWGYGMVWVVIITMVTGMLVYFRRKKWL